MTFKNYLTEARLAPLYHSTSLDSFKSIMDSGIILPKTSHEHFKLLMKNPQPKSEEIQGVSLTRSFKLAKAWKTKGIVIEFDQQELSKRFKIKPIQFWTGPARKTDYYGDRNEYEEFVITNKGIPFNDVFVKRLYVSKTAERYFSDQEIETRVDLELNGSYNTDYNARYLVTMQKSLEVIEHLKKDKRVVFY